MLVLAVVHGAGRLGAIRETMNPLGMFKEQSTVVAGNDAYASGWPTDVGPSLLEWSRKPLLGEGFGTHNPTGPDANAGLLDDQWLGTLLETATSAFLA